MMFTIIMRQTIRNYIVISNSISIPYHVAIVGRSVTVCRDSMNMQSSIYI